MMRPVGDWGAGWGRSLMALFGLPKRAIKLRPQLAPRPYLALLATLN